ncbi:MAG: PTS sugar transporter subunit IIA [Eggerthellaceae bacterium]|nr:PTS sugar transporter subunit IIA [Eggerthellaceae bacterium]
MFSIVDVDDEHLEALSQISELIDDEKLFEKFKTIDDAEWVLDYLTKIIYFYSKFIDIAINLL